MPSCADPQALLDFLNEVHRIDPAVLPALIAHRVECNQALADHPTVQVMAPPDGDRFRVGLLGLINGWVGGHGRVIIAHYDDDNALTGFVLGDAPLDVGSTTD